MTLRSRLTTIHESLDFLFCHPFTCTGSKASFLLFSPFVNKVQICSIDMYQSVQVAVVGKEELLVNGKNASNHISK